MPSLRARLMRLESRLCSPPLTAEQLQKIARFDAFLIALASEHEQPISAALFPFALGIEEMPHRGLSSWFLEIIAGEAFCPARIPPEVTVCT